LTCHIGDFNGDGWPDVLHKVYPGTNPYYLYLNPKGESRRWERSVAYGPSGPSENSVFADMDGDGQKELVSGGDGYGIVYVKPDPTDASKPWIVHPVTERAQYGAHGIGAGDVNGDGKIDGLRGYGWWENPGDPKSTSWKFHPAVFGRNGGGAQLEVYDVNGDGINDVVTSLEGHSYGLAWYEQKKDGSFVEHLIMDHDPAMSNGVVITEMHGLMAADVDGDGLKDIVTGKFRDHKIETHFSYSWPADEDADNVVYYFKGVRDPKAPGGARFVPRLVHNNSGIGRQPLVLDLNGDGVMDISVNGRAGTYIYWGRKPAAPAKPKPTANE
jgi:hypothetical protein